jgi:hypothetical protein
MAFPADPLDATFELWISDQWEDITERVYQRDGVSISRGRSSEAGHVDPSTCRLTVNNADGDLSPRNPTGSWYGLIGRNTPLRVRVSPASDPHLLITDQGDGATTPDSAGLSITGDIDVRIEVERENWAEQVALAGKFESTGNQRSWSFEANADKTLTLRWSADGTSAVLVKTSTAAMSVADGDRLALRVTLDVNNGAAGNDVRFYTAPSIGGSWTQLGSTVTTAGTTSIFDGTGQQEVGRVADVGIDGFIGRIYGFEVYQGIAGTLRGDLDFAAVDPTSTSLTDSQANLWTLDSTATVVDPGLRFLGEISTWPQRWDPTGADVHVPLEASGILRRLQQGASPLRSTLYRGLTRLANPPVAYWPCEDGDDATVISSALTGGHPMTLKGGLPDFGSFDGFKCSGPLPTFSETEWTGLVPDYTGTGDIQVRFLMQVPSGGALDAEGICLLRTTGTVYEWRLLYETGGGDLTLQAYDAAGTQLFTQTGDFNIDGDLVLVSIELDQVGSDIEWTVQTLGVGSTVPTALSNTLASRTISKATAVVMNAGADHTDIAVGHISVHDEITDILELVDLVNAYEGEAAGRRIQRLCAEKGISVRAIADSPARGPFNDSAATGYQLPRTLVELLREAEDADGGILYEPRDLLGLAYRTRESLYEQAAGLTLDYSAQDVTALEPVDDDQHVRNDVTVQRIGGAAARAVRDTGPLSVAAPPDGVGRYDEQHDLSLEDDSTLGHRAGWLLHLGTVDEARYPQITVSLSRPNFTGANASQALAAQDLDVGDRLAVTDLPTWVAVDDVSQLAHGFTETMSGFVHRIAVNCAPARPWEQPGVYDDHHHPDRLRRPVRRHLRGRRRLHRHRRHPPLPLDRADLGDHRARRRQRLLPPTHAPSRRPRPVRHGRAAPGRRHPGLQRVSPARISGQLHRLPDPLPHRPMTPPDDGSQLADEAAAYLAGSTFSAALAAFLTAQLQPLHAMAAHGGGDPDGQVERAAAKLLRQAAASLLASAYALDPDLFKSGQLDLPELGSTRPD